LAGILQLAVSAWMVCLSMAAAKSKRRFKQDICYKTVIDKRKDPGSKMPGSNQ
jgi:hypothetical protein